MFCRQARSLISLKSTTMALDAFNIFNHKRTQRPVLKEPASQKISDKRNSEGKCFNSRRNACTWFRTFTFYGRAIKSFLNDDDDGGCWVFLCTRRKKCVRNDDNGLSPTLSETEAEFRRPPVAFQREHKKQQEKYFSLWSNVSWMTKQTKLPVLCAECWSLPAAWGNFFTAVVHFLCEVATTKEQKHYMKYYIWEGR